MRTTNLANEFAKKGYPSTILVTKEIAENVFFERHKDVKLVSLKEYVGLHSNDTAVAKNKRKRNLRIRFLKYLRYISRFFPSWDKKLAEEIKGLRHTEDISVFISNHSDCIYIPFGVEYFVKTFYGSKGTNCKIVYAERNAPELEFPSEPKEKKHLFKMLSKADSAVLQTHDELKFFNGILKKSTIIHNPVKANLPEPFCGERRKVVVNFCRIAEQKNLPMLINAFVTFHKAHPEYTLEIYGNTVEKNEDELKENLNKMITSLDADEFIKILPPRGDVHSVVRDCAMFVSSSDFEGLSNSMIEAMAIGLPCICTDCLGGGAREMITDGENGLLVPINDANALCEAMKKMSEDETFAKKCSENAVKIRNELSVQKIAEKWLKVIDL